MPIQPLVLKFLNGRSMLNFNTNTKNNDEWLTPPDFVNIFGPFDLDPCAPVNRPWPMAKKHYTREDNGLALPWEGCVWLNPPYGRHTFEWIERLAEHGSGLALIFARTETMGFHKQVWDKAYAVFFFQGRICFHYVTGKKAVRQMLHPARWPIRKMTQKV